MLADHISAVFSMNIYCIPVLKSSIISTNSQGLAISHIKAPETNFDLAIKKERSTLNNLGSTRVPGDTTKFQDHRAVSSRRFLRFFPNMSMVAMLSM